MARMSFTSFSPCFTTVLMVAFITGNKIYNIYGRARELYIDDWLMNCERIAMVVLLRKWHSVLALDLVSYHFFSKSSAKTTFLV